MPLNSEQQAFYDACINKQQHIVCSGKGGTGKTYLIVELLNYFKSSKNKESNQAIIIPELDIEFTALMKNVFRKLVLSSLESISTVVVGVKYGTGSEYILSVVQQLSLALQKIFNDATPFGGRRVIFLGLLDYQQRDTLLQTLDSYGQPALWYELTVNEGHIERF